MPHPFCFTLSNSSFWCPLATSLLWLGLKIQGTFSYLKLVSATKDADSKMWLASMGKIYFYFEPDPAGITGIVEFRAKNASPSGPRAPISSARSPRRVSVTSREICQAKSDEKRDPRCLPPFQLIFRTLYTVHGAF
ncbi:hypothetical protein C8R46DRAFT_1341651 [Mycena filopes]|nr:hypothetical protein C8R46DRAFT_1341651 [Mycena filopes]